MSNKIKVMLCDCGSIFAPVYWSEEKQKFVCKVCIGYPDDSYLYKKKNEHHKDNR